MPYRTLVSVSLALCALVVSPSIRAEEANRAESTESTVAEVTVSPERSSNAPSTQSNESVQAGVLPVAGDPSLNESIRGLDVVVHADGSRSVDLEERFSNILVLDLREESSAVMCTTDLVSVLRKIHLARDAESGGE